MLANMRDEYASVDAAMFRKAELERLASDRKIEDFKNAATTTLKRLSEDQERAIVNGFDALMDAELGSL